jgi:peptide/nickel transport system substrate-binding protein
MPRSGKRLQEGENMKKRLALLGIFVLLLALATTAVACGGGAKSSAVPEVVNVGIDGDPTDLDPYTTLGHRNGTTHPIWVQPLAYLMPDGTFKGILMEKYKADDAKTITVTLFNNIVDQAGNPFKASDVAFGIGKCVEAKQQKAGSIAKAEAIDDLNVKITFSHDAYLSNVTDVLTGLYFVTEKAWTASPDHMITDPVTTAPYKVTKYTSGSQMTVEKTATYWKTDEGLKTPVEQANVKTINFFIIMDLNQMAIALKSGQIDFAQNIALDNVADVTASGTTMVKSFGEAMNHVLYPNCDPASKMSDPKVREAVFYAINSAAIVKRMFGDSATLSKAMGADHYSDYNKAWATADYFKFDAAKAKSMLAEAGYNETNKLKLKLLVMEQPTFKGLMELVQGFLNETGVIDAQLTAVNGGSYMPVAGDAAQWDLQQFPTFSFDFLASTFMNLTPEWGPTGKPMNMATDPQLQTLVKAAMTVGTHSQETVNAAQDYINANAYAYGVSANYINAAYPSWCTEFVLGDQLWLIPNACTYKAK